MASRLAYLLLFALLALHVALYFGFKVDDAFILLRYADNLRRGDGLTFNPGERVEGFTSPALVIIDAAFLTLGWNALTASKILGTLCGFALVAVTVRLARAVSATRWVPLFAGVLVVAQPSVAVGCVNGLETLPFAACVTGALLVTLTARTIRDSVLVGGLLSLAIFLRPDGVLALLLAIVYTFRRETSPSRWRMLGGLVSIPLLVAAPLLAWKAAYFHSLVPNTFVAKIPTAATGRLQSGLEYLVELSPTQWELVGVLGLCVLAMRRGGALRTLAMFAIIWTAGVVYTGGDWIPLRRFLVPTVPVAAVGLALTLEACMGWLAELLPSRASLARFAVGAAWAAWLLPGTARAIADATQGTDMFTAGTTTGREPLGEWLRALGKPTAAVAMLDVGAVAYRSQMNVIDLGGLTDAKIAALLHSSPGWFISHLFFPTVPAARRIVADVLGRRPEFIVLELFGDFPHIAASRYESEKPDPLGAHAQEQAFITTPEFRRSYRYVCQFHERRDLEYNVFVRADYTAPLPTVVDGDGRVYCPIP